MILSVLYLLVRRVPGCVMVLARREVSKDADTRGGPLGGTRQIHAQGRDPDIWHLVPFNLIDTMYPWR